jgi:hypothetical protein
MQEIASLCLFISTSMPRDQTPHAQSLRQDLDIQSGYGVLTFPNGDNVKGEWENGSCPDGTGRHTSADGSVYTGHLSAMSKHPLEEGKARSHRGEKETEFAHTFFGNGTCEYKDGTRYEGEWRDSQPNGEGSVLNPDGNFFTGQWIRGKPKVIVFPLSCVRSVI